MTEQEKKELTEIIRKEEGSGCVVFIVLVLLFILLTVMMSNHKELKRKIEGLEDKMEELKQERNKL